MKTIWLQKLALLFRAVTNPSSNSLTCRYVSVGSASEIWHIYKKKKMLSVLVYSMLSVTRFSSSFVTLCSLWNSICCCHTHKIRSCYSLCPSLCLGIKAQTLLWYSSFTAWFSFNFFFYVLLPFSSLSILLLSQVDLLLKNLVFLHNGIGLFLSSH